MVDLTPEIIADSNNIDDTTNHSAPLIRANVFMQVLQILQLENDINGEITANHIREWINYDEIDHDSGVNMISFENSIDVHNDDATNDNSRVDAASMRERQLDDNHIINDAASEASGATTISVNQYLNNIEQPQNNREIEEIRFEN